MVRNLRIRLEDPSGKFGFCGGETWFWMVGVKKVVVVELVVLLSYIPVCDSNNVY